MRPFFPTFAALAMTLATPLAASAKPADVLYVGGDIVAVNDAQPNAEALAVKDGKIIAVGTRADVEQVHKGAATKIVDLAGKTLMPSFLAALKRDADVSPQRLRQRKHMNTALRIIDEVGFEPMTRQEASLFFRLVSYRYGRGSILITTNKGVAEWPAVLAGDEVLATAILDRLLHRSHVLNISGRSYRLRELDRAAAAARATS